MADRSSIEWTQATWNPVTGCSKVSPGCAHCYAETFAERFRGVPGHPYEQGFDLRFWPARLDQPFRWKRPRLIFVNSMSDLFHEDIPPSYIEHVFDVMARAQHHTFQVLTKRADRLLELAPDLPWPINVWMGVSIENRRFVGRADCLRQVPAAVRFISAEPLLGPLKGLDLTGIDWLISGGESGPRHRPVKEEWLLDLRDRCGRDGVTFFLNNGADIVQRAADGALKDEPGMGCRRQPTDGQAPCVVTRRRRDATGTWKRPVWPNCSPGRTCFLSNQWAMIFSPTSWSVAWSRKYIGAPGRPPAVKSDVVV